MAALILGLICSVSTLGSNLFDEIKKRPEGFLTPNETRPHHALSIFQKNRGGSYVTVGTERAFVGAALSNASRLVVVDINPSVILFAEINSLLLSISKDRKDYVSLRADASVAEWKRRGGKLRVPSTNWLLDEKAWLFWKTRVRNVPVAAKGFSCFTYPDLADKEDCFVNANYSRDDKLFHRLHLLARQGKIEAHLLNLLELEKVRALVNDLKGTKLGILDLSNLWLDRYLGAAGVANVIEAFRPLSHPDSIILQTRFIPQRPGGDWNYFYSTYRGLLSSAPQP